MIRIIKICALFVLLFISCNKTTTCKNINKIGDYILSLDNTRDELGIKKDMSPFNIVLETTDNQLFTFPVDFLDTLYIEWGRKKKYSEFICLLISGELKLEADFITTFFDAHLLKVDESKLKNMNNLGVDKTVEYYGVLKDSSFLLILFSNKDLDNLTYFLYTNGFLFAEDDYNGRIIFIKPENLAL